MATQSGEDEKAGAPGFALALRDEIANQTLTRLHGLRAGNTDIDVCQGRDSLWLLARRSGRGGFALRAVYCPGTPLEVTVAEQKDGECRLNVRGSWGTFMAVVSVPDAAQSLLRCRVCLRPTDDILLPPCPHDLYPLDANGDPTKTVGLVHAAQRGLNAALVYFSLSKPDFGGVLYFQNLTDLNGYFQTTETKPDGVVGGRWPELGYAMPVSVEKPLRRNEEVVISDVFLRWCDECACDPRQSSRLFLDLLAGIYARLDRPTPQVHDWPSLAAQTARDLVRAPEATVRHYGDLYLRPYLAAEEPDSMTQLTVLMPLREYVNWTGKPLPLADDLRKGIKHFFDADLEAFRRYLPVARNEKDLNLVDSWYLYHPLSNLGRLALEGDTEARDLFLRAVEYGIKAGRHFSYHWPVQYKMDTLEVVTGPRKPGEPGQSDVGGLYAHVMTQAWELTGKKRYLDEAKKAIDALRDMEFNLEYQANITSWGACGCLRMWEITGDPFYLDQSYVFIASYFHNCLFWESEIDNAHFYSTFLGATCLHDGPYMACYECFESYGSFYDFLRRGHDALPNSIRLLLAELCKYTTSRAWAYYPAHLPREALATDIRNGRIDPKLAFPLEDLYGDGQPAGQVGQEIYGCGAAFVFTTRAYRRLRNAPFLLFAEYPLLNMQEFDEPRVSFTLCGGDGFPCQVRLISGHGKSLPSVMARVGGKEIHGHVTPEGHCAFDVAAGSAVEICWTPEA